MSVIDDHLKKLSLPEQKALERVRQIVKQTVPEAEEAISYGMPGFRYNKKYLIGFAAFKEHLSIFPGAGAVEKLKNTLGTHRTSKGTIQFTLDEPLSEELIKQIVRSRRDDISS